MNIPNDSHHDDAADELLANAARAILSLSPLMTHDEHTKRDLIVAARAAKRGYFTPAENEWLVQRFERYLTGRAGLLQTINELRPLADRRLRDVDDRQSMLATFVAYTAACLLIRAGRFLLHSAAPHRLARKKLDEAIPERGIPRKQFSSIYASLTKPRNALAMHDARKYVHTHRDAIKALASESPDLAALLELLADAEQYLETGKRNFFKNRVRYRWHSWRRRRRSAAHMASFGIFEATGRVIADMRNPLHKKRVTPEIRQAVAAMLQPGDVIITRHDDAMSNLFLPGFWPHGALYIGKCDSIERMQLEVDDERRSRWIDSICVLEARKDGVRFRPLDDTLAVDCFVVIRPQLTSQEVAASLSRVLKHEGKLYDFEFDFTRADRLVCTEVIYRAFDGCGPINMELKRRTGRLTFSAEDLLDLAICGNGFDPVGVFGIAGTSGLVAEPDVTRVLKASYT